MSSRSTRYILTMFLCGFTFVVSACTNSDSGRPSGAASVKPPTDRLRPFVHENRNWTEHELYAFLGALSPEDRKSVCKALGIKAATADQPDLKLELNRLQKGLLWASSNVLAYPFRDEGAIYYHDLCMWVARELGVDDWVVRSQPTIIVERAICEALWAKIWDKLDEAQRAELIRNLGTSQIGGTAVASMTGTAALAALAGSVNFAGFAFYQSMSVTLCTVSGWFGVTLPFGAYTGASSIVAVLSGPVGWALVGVGAVASTALAGKADVQKTAAFIVQVHVLKARALNASGETVPDVPRKP